MGSEGAVSGGGGAGSDVWEGWLTPTFRSDGEGKEEEGGGG